MTGAQIQAAVVERVMAAYDATHPHHPDTDRREDFRRLLVVAADTVAMEIVNADRPTDAQLAEMEAHENGLRDDEKEAERQAYQRRLAGVEW